MEFRRGKFNVHELEAEHHELVEKLDDDGKTAARDEDKQRFRWSGTDWEVYDYNGDPTWHVQGTERGLKTLLSLLGIGERS